MMDSGRALGDKMLATEDRHFVQFFLKPGLLFSFVG
jgi:hypothetical protein